MKNLLKNFALFIALTIAFSSLTGCPTATTQKGPVDETKPGTDSTETKKTDAVDYPAPPAAIAQTEIKMLDGGTFKLEDQKGKVILFNLWGVWCGPCIAEMPSLVALQEKYRDKNFEIIGLNIGDADGGVETEENIKAFAPQHNLNYKLGYADRKLFDEFVRVTKMSGVPQSVLINREGKLIGVFTGGGPRVINLMKETVEKAVN